MLRPLAEAATYADISEHMKLATVRSHLTNLYGKLGVRSLAEVETQKGTGLVAPVLSRAVSSTTLPGATGRHSESARESPLPCRM